MIALCASSSFLTARFSSATSSEVGVAITLTEIIALSLKDTRDLELSNSHLAIPITPDSDGNLGTADLVADVSTNNLTGYTLTMNSQTSNTSLVHTTGAGSNITSTSAALASPAVLTPNHWGYYRWEDGRVSTPTTFSRIPGTSPDTLRVTAAPAATSNTTLSFGANVDIMQARGSYQQTMVLTVVANYVPIPPPQEPDPNNPTTYGAMQQMTNAECSTTRGTAFDARNSQAYFVRKIGNLCWMETNLRYAGNGNWNSTWGYPDDRYTTSAMNTMGGYFDPGGSAILDVQTPANNTTFYGYLYGWCAAMGGQVNACNYGTSGFDTTRSICPAGWRLPTGGISYPTDFKDLNIAVNGGSTTSQLGLINNFLAVHSGYYNGSSLNFEERGRGGFYWSSNVRDATYAYYLVFDNTGVAPGTGTSGWKYNGLALRCVM